MQILRPEPVTFSNALQYAQVVTQAFSRSPQDLSRARTEINAREKRNQRLSIPCGPDKQLELLTNLSKLDWPLIAEDLKYKFYDGKIIEQLHCLFSSLTFNMPYNDELTQYNHRLRHYLRSLERIGSDSAFGVALNPYIEGVNDIFVIKAPKISDEESNFMTYHESFIGQVALNKLRYMGVYNFAFVYGAFSCSIPLVDKNDGETITWCTQTNVGANYVVYENISNSISFADYVAKNSNFNVLKNYFEILCALQYANSTLDFTHYDLHANNVLIRKLPQKMSIPVHVDNVIYYIYDDELPVMIDYGTSHIKINGEAYGTPGREFASTFAFGSFPLYDAWRLLFALLSEVWNARSNEIDFFEPIFHYFVDPSISIHDYLMKANERDANDNRVNYWYLASYAWTQERDTLNTINVMNLIIRDYPEIANLFTTEPIINSVTLSCKSTQACTEGLNKYLVNNADPDLYAIYNLILYGGQDVVNNLLAQTPQMDLQLQKSLNGLTPELQVIKQNMTTLLNGIYDINNIDYGQMMNLFIIYDDFYELTFQYFLLRNLVNKFNLVYDFRAIEYDIEILKDRIETTFNLILKSLHKNGQNVKEQMVRQYLGIPSQGDLIIKLF